MLAGICAAVLVCFLLKAGSASGQASEVGEFNIKTWTIEDGLPENSVTAIAQTRDGYLWLGTRGGLVRFDGIDFTVFDVATTPALASNRILSILAASNGDLWLGTERSGVIRYRDGEFISYRKSKNAPAGRVRSIVEDRLGVIWFGAASLVRYADEEFKTVGGATGIKQVWSLHVDRDGDLWVASDQGLSHLHNGRDRAIPATDSRLKPPVHFVGEDSQGTLWASGTDWLATVRDGQLISAKETGDLRAPLTASLIDQYGSAWYVGRSGMYTRSEAVDTWNQLDPTASLSRVSPLRTAKLRGALSIFEDREGSIWVGTQDSGLFQLRRSWFTTIPLPTAGRLRNGVCLFSDGAGGFWTLLDDGITHFINNAWEDVPLSSDIRRVATFTAGRDGTLWIAAPGGKPLLKFNDGALERYDPGVGHIHRMLESRDGVLWIVSKDGLSTFEKGRFKSVWHRGTLPEQALPVTMYESSDGTVWVGANRMITGYRDGKSVQYGHADGLPDAEVRSMLETADGSFWVSTYGAGLVRLRDRKFTKITKCDGLPDNALGKILDDDYGNLWINSNRGVFRVSLDELNAFADGRAPRITARLIETGEGNGWNGGRTIDGKLWFPTTQDLVIIDASRIGNSTIPLVATIKSVIADGIVVQHDAPVQIQPDITQLDIRYAAASFIDPKGVRFRYMLDGYDENWVEVGTLRTAHYNKLPPGEYRFRVTACNSDGVWSGSEAVLSVTILPHFYETAWFLALCGLAATATMFVGHRIRTQSIRRRNAELRAEIEGRKFAEEALQESGRRLRSVLDGLFEAPIGLCFLDCELRYVFINEWLAKLNEISVEEHLGRTLREVLPDVVAGVEAQLRHVLETGEPVIDGTVEAETPANPGQKHVFQHNYYPVMGGDGKVVGVSCAVQDFTERKRAEEALRLAHEELEERVRQRTDQLTKTNKRLRQEIVERQRVEATLRLQGQIVDSMAEGISLVRPSDGIMIYCNPPFEHMFGYKPGELVGKHVTVCNASGESSPEEVADEIIQSLEETKSWTGEVHNVKKDGTRFWSHTNVTTLQHPDYGEVWVAVKEDITQRKRAEEVLRESEERFRVVFESAPFGMAIVDPGGKPLRYNRAFQEMLGYSEQELQERDVADGYTYPEDVEATRKLFAELRQGKRDQYQLDKRYVRKDGQIVWGSLAITSVRDAQGDIKYLIATVKDITERKRSEEALRTSEERLALALEATSEGVWDWKIATGEMFFSPRWCKTLCFDPSEVEPHGRFWEGLVHPEDMPRFTEALNAHFEQKTELFECEVRLRMKSGEYRWNLDRGKVVARDEDGKPLRMVGVDVDITERKLAEEVLRESETKYRSLVESANAVPWKVELATGRFTYIGQQVEQLLGYPMNSWVGLDTWSDRIHPEDREQAKAYCMVATSRGEDHHFEYRAIAADGRHVWIRDVVSVIMGEQGPTEVIGFMFDITERKRAEEQARQLQADLAHMLRLSSMGEMATGLAHELNQPLTVISNYAQGCVRRLKSNAIGPEELGDILVRIATQAQRSSSIIRGLGNLVRKSSALRSEIDINRCIMEVSDLANAEAAQHHAKARFELETNLPPVMADQTQLQQVILNLVQNGCEAIEDTPESRRAVTVRTKQRGDRELEISVSDNGRGISEALGERLFEAFFTTKTQGIGMGLAISRSIVESHGGRLWATPNRGKGTTFHFTLPIVGGHDGDE